MLKWSVVDKGRYRDYEDVVPLLDLGLLRLLRRRRVTAARLSRIAVSVDELGGFASARLMLATLNTMAWLSDIPIFVIPQEWSRDGRSLPEKLGSMKPGSSFRQQVLPRYAAPPDISVPKRKKKFTIS